jgi:hypothetical protein
VNVLLIALHGQSVTLSRRQSVYENRHLLAAGPFKQKRRAATSQTRNANRAQFLIQFDRYADARKLPFSVEQFNKFSQPSECHAVLLVAIDAME